MSTSDRILFDSNQIDSTAREVEHFRAEFESHVAEVRGERERSTVSFTGLAGDEFRGLCDRWLADAEAFTATLSELTGWLDARNADYASARAASQSMFPG